MEEKGAEDKKEEELGKGEEWGIRKRRSGG